MISAFLVPCKVASALSTKASGPSPTLGLRPETQNVGQPHAHMHSVDTHKKSHKVLYIRGYPWKAKDVQGYGNLWNLQSSMEIYGSLTKSKTSTKILQDITQETMSYESL